MTASEVRALFAVAVAPRGRFARRRHAVRAGAADDEVLDVVARGARASTGDVALQYGGGQGASALRERLRRR